MSYLGKWGTGLVGKKIKRRVCKRCFKVFSTYFNRPETCEDCRKHAIPERFVVN